jgi:predicted DNA-binding transcriptional regulator YafY
MSIDQDKLALMMEFKPGQVLRFRYVNWQGVVANRTTRVIELTFGKTEWHPEPQWLLKAYDIEKNAVRFFALQDMVPIGDIS